MSETRYCSNCGAQLAPNTKFCPSCGTAVGGAAAASSGGTPSADKLPVLVMNGLFNMNTIEAHDDCVIIKSDDVVRSIPYRDVRAILLSKVNVNNDLGRIVVASSADDDHVIDLNDADHEPCIFRYNMRLKNDEAASFCEQLRQRVRRSRTTAGN